MLLKPGDGLKFTEPTKIELELFPAARASKILINLEATNAESVTFTPDNPELLGTTKVCT